MPECNRVVNQGEWKCGVSVMAGADLELVRVILGHSDLDTTKKCVSVTDKHLDKTLDLIGFSAHTDRYKMIPFKKKG
jgi:hypothetical protein